MIFKWPWPTQTKLDIILLYYYTADFLVEPQQLMFAVTYENELQMLPWSSNENNLEYLHNLDIQIVEHITNTISTGEKT